MAPLKRISEIGAPVSRTRDITMPAPTGPRMMTTRARPIRRRIERPFVVPQTAFTAPSTTKNISTDVTRKKIDTTAERPCARSVRSRMLFTSSRLAPGTKARMIRKKPVPESPNRVEVRMVTAALSGTNERSDENARLDARSKPRASWNPRNARARTTREKERTFRGVRSRVRPRVMVRQGTRRAGTTRALVRTFTEKPPRGRGVDDGDQRHSREHRQSRRGQDRRRPRVRRGPGGADP